jgi:hypothetical protein
MEVDKTIQISIPVYYDITVNNGVMVVSDRDPPKKILLSLLKQLELTQLNNNVSQSGW